MRGFLLLLLVGCGADQFTHVDAGADAASDAAGDLAVDSRADAAGCADGTREAFLNTAMFPNIAACSGGWSVPGVTTMASNGTPCNRMSGNSSANPSGMGCSVEDLCAPGWHVCRTSVDVAMHLPMNVTTCNPPDATMTGFWVTRQTTGPSFNCPPPMDSANNVGGCGGAGQAPAGFTSCAPLNRVVTYLDCMAAPGWACGNATMTDQEAAVITKSSVDFGGAMCCRN